MAAQNSLVFCRSMLLAVISILLLHKVYAQHPVIDKDHHDKITNCGKLPVTPSSRIINGEKSRIHYPWVILVVRVYEGKTVEFCGGSILTKRKVIL